MNDPAQNQGKDLRAQAIGALTDDDQKQVGIAKPVAGGEEREPVKVDQEKVPVVEVGGEHEKIPEEVEGWLEKLERGEEVKLPQSVKHKGKILVEPAEPQVDEKVVLPTTQETIQKGVHSNVFTSVRWLAEWCLRMIKKFHGAVVYREK